MSNTHQTGRYLDKNTVCFLFIWGQAYILGFCILHIDEPSLCIVSIKIFSLIKVFNHTFASPDLLEHVIGPLEQVSLLIVITWHPLSSGSWLNISIICSNYSAKCYNSLQKCSFCDFYANPHSSWPPKPILCFHWLNLKVLLIFLIVHVNDGRVVFLYKVYCVKLKSKRTAFTHTLACIHELLLRSVTHDLFSIFGMQELLNYQCYNVYTYSWLQYVF